MNLDFQIFQVINNLANKNIYLDWLGIFAAKYLIFIIVAVVLGLAILKKDRIYKLMAFNAFVAAGWAWVINNLIGLIYFRPRPFVNHEVLKLIQKSALEKSFPSDHVAISFAIAFAIYFYNKKLGIIFLILALIVGLGRIFVGVHYPLDILGGIIVGLLSAFLAKRILKNRL
jgi:undecaprenyl-diphosphatase